MASGTEPEPVILNRIAFINDCNDLNKTGIYYAIDTSTNTPSQYGVVLHLNLQSDVKAQLFIGVSNTALYYRRSVQNEWKSWYRLDGTLVS